MRPWGPWSSRGDYGQGTTDWVEPEDLEPSIYAQLTTPGPEESEPEHITCVEYTASWISTPIDGFPLEPTGPSLAALDTPGIAALVNRGVTHTGPCSTFGTDEPQLSIDARRIQDFIAEVIALQTSDEYDDTFHRPDPVVVLGVIGLVARACQIAPGLPPFEVAADGSGGIRVRWLRGAHEACLVVPRTGHAASYLYHQGPGGPGIIQRPEAGILAAHLQRVLEAR